MQVKRMPARVVFVLALCSVVLLMPGARMLAATQTREEGLTEVRRILALAGQSASVVKDSEERFLLLGNIARMQAKAGDFAGARKTTAGVQESIITSDGGQTGPYLSPILADIALAQAKSGDFTGALKAIEGIAEEKEKYRALRDIATEQAAAGDFAGALKTAAIIEPDMRFFGPEGIEARAGEAGALGSIAGAQAKAGDAAGAVETLQRAHRIMESIIDNDSKAWFMAFLATAQAEMGDIAGALQEGASLQNDAARSHVLLAVARQQAGAGDIAGARNTAAKMINSSEKGQVLVWAAEAALRAKDRNAALTTLQEAAGLVQTAEMDEDALHVWTSIAAMQAAAGDAADAYKMVAALKNPAVQMPAIHSIAESQANAGDIAAVGQTLEITGKLCLSPQNLVLLKSDVRTLLALAQVKTGDRPGALNTLQQVMQDITKAIGCEPQSTGLILQRIASAQAKAGDFTAARKTIAAIGKEYPGSFRQEGLQMVARTQAESGDTSGVLAWAEKLRAPADKVCVLLGVAEGILDALCPAYKLEEFPRISRRSD